MKKMKSWNKRKKKLFLTEKYGELLPCEGNIEIYHWRLSILHLIKLKKIGRRAERNIKKGID